MQQTLSPFFYLLSSICFILALQGLSSAKTARAGNRWGIVGMGLAVGTTLVAFPLQAYTLIAFGIALGGGIGYVIALKIHMTALPQLIAAFHSLVGLAAVFVAAAAFAHPEAFHLTSAIKGSLSFASLFEMGLGVIIGAITFTGSLVAFGKLQGLLSGQPLLFAGQHVLNAFLGSVLCVALLLFSILGFPSLFGLILLLSFTLGVLLILPIGGADMPVVISMLNSYSGWAAAGVGFTLSNPLLIIVGALVGSSGAILSYVMCRGMNRSLIHILLGGFGGEPAAASLAASDPTQASVKSGFAEDAAFILKNAASVIIVPGYGMAVSQAQHALKELTDLLKKNGALVRYAIHPVAGRMPGHMNVLLAEANVPYEDVKELENINADFTSTDVALVIGANDVTNPAAKTDSTSPIYGMPVLDVGKAGTTLFIKRSLASGYAGVPNPLFSQDNTLMLFGDGKKMCEDIIKAFQE